MVVTVVVGLVAFWWWVLVAWSCPAGGFGGGPGDAEDLVGLVVCLVPTYLAW